MARLWLVMDLDETLMHARRRPLDRPALFQLGEFYVYGRPGVGEFLRKASERFYLGVWTTASEGFALGVVAGLIEPLGVELGFVWSRMDCAREYDEENEKFLFLKDLRELERRRGLKVSSVLLLDDSAWKARRQPENHVSIEPWYGEESDDALERLWVELASVEWGEDVRGVWSGRG